MDPPDFRAIDGRRAALADGAAKKVQFHYFFRVFVPDDLEGYGNSDANAQLFIEFPPQAFFQTFSLFSLPAGKLPEAGQMHACATFGDKIPPFTADQAGGYFDDFRHDVFP